MNMHVALREGNGDSGCTELAQNGNAQRVLCL
jgi:hypothetical protein